MILSHLETHDIIAYDVFAWKSRGHPLDHHSWSPLLHHGTLWTHSSVLTTFLHIILPFRLALDGLSFIYKLIGGLVTKRHVICTLNYF